MGRDLQLPPHGCLRHGNWLQVSGSCYWLLLLLNAVVADILVAITVADAVVDGTHQAVAHTTNSSSIKQHRIGGVAHFRYSYSSSVSTSRSPDS